MKAPFSLRIQKLSTVASAPPQAAKDGGAAPQPPKDGDKGDDALSRLVKLAPSEVMTVYLAGKAAFDKNIAELGLGMVIVCFLWRWWTTQKAGEPTQWVAIISATVSFVLWVYASGGAIYPGGTLDATKASFIALVWTLLVAPNLPGNKGD